MDRSPISYGYGGTDGDGHWIVYGWQPVGDCHTYRADRVTALEIPDWLEPQAMYEDYEDPEF